MPVFLYGHSIGASIIFSFCFANPNINLQGVISTNAYVRLQNKVTYPKKKLLSLLNRIVPFVMINNYVDFCHSSKNNYHIKKAADDDVQWTFLTIKMAYNIMKLCDYVLKNCDKFKTPVLLIHGKEDKVASHLNSIDLYRLIES